MKKRINQRLTLNKETLRNLSNRDLESAMGGLTQASQYWCPTEDPNCTASGCPSRWSDCC